MKSNFVPAHSVELSDNEIKKIVKDNNVKVIKLQFTDLNGQVKNLSVQVSQIDKLLNNEMILDGSSIKGFRSIETADMYLYPDKKTFTLLPWLSKETGNAARLICDIYNADATPFEGCPRANLKRVIAEAKEWGFEMQVGPEAEFFLFKKDENGMATTITNDFAGYYDAGPDDKGEEIRTKIVDGLETMGFEIETSHHEVARGQHEIGFKHADALTTADNLATFKMAVKAIADKNGLHATFMPKPLVGINGSGMHCNISLYNKGKNAFFDEDKPNHLSDITFHAIGGILKHIRAVTAIANPTVNSYKRLVPGYEAPVYLAWSLENRSALVRVLAKKDEETRIELRSPDPSCNPYLAFAAILTAVMDGIKKKLTPPEAVDSNIYKLSFKERKRYKINSLPSSLNEALDIMERSTIVRLALGEHIYNEFISAKRREWDSFSTYVSGWELDRYLARY
ncbi:MAG: type I glutamate--ammonia ligase [Candidatus Gastranaerophilales bacterium]|nr:type I glutamate--ammonia ligase [Candidatus Gastranaerophilales bacterium]